MLSQARKQLFQVRNGDRLLSRDVRKCHWSLVVLQCQLHHRGYRVTAFG